MQQQSENDRSTVDLVWRAEGQNSHVCRPSPLLIRRWRRRCRCRRRSSPQELFLAGVAGLESRAALQHTAPAGVAGGY